MSARLLSRNCYLEAEALWNGQSKDEADLIYEAIFLVSIERPSWPIRAVTAAATAIVDQYQRKQAALRETQ